MTVKSDDIVGRVKVYEALVKGKPIDQAGIPESFRVLIKEFQALGLDVQIENEKNELVSLKDMEQDEEDADSLKIEELTNLLEEIKLYDINNYYDKLIIDINPILEGNNIKIKLPQLPPNTEEDVKLIKEEIKKIVDEIIEIDSLKQTGKEDYLETQEVTEEIIDIVKKLDEKIQEYKRNLDIYEFIDIELLATSLVQDKEIKA